MWTLLSGALEAGRPPWFHRHREDLGPGDEGRTGQRWFAETNPLPWSGPLVPLPCRRLLTPPPLVSRAQMAWVPDKPEHLVPLPRARHPVVPNCEEATVDSGGSFSSFVRDSPESSGAPALVRGLTGESPWLLEQGRSRVGWVGSGLYNEGIRSCGRRFSSERNGGT